MPSASDYVIIGIACIGIAFIIGMCIVSVVDKKMSDIVINVPKAEVVVNIDDCKNKNVEEFTPTDSVQQPSPTQTSSVPKPSSTPKPVAKTTSTKSKLTKSVKKNGLKFLNPYEGDDELYPDTAGMREYAVMGCRDRTKKFKLFPNTVACNVPNYLTAENYYTKNFEYPVAPGQSEERLLGADYTDSNFLAKPDVSYRVISLSRNKLSTKPPYPANYWFA